jgi:hypothetical protein
MAPKLKCKHCCASTCELINSLVYENVWLSGKKLLLAQTLDWHDQLLNWSKNGKADWVGKKVGTIHGVWYLGDSQEERVPNIWKCWFGWMGESGLMKGGVCLLAWQGYCV